MLQKHESGSLPIPQAEGRKDGGHDGETLTASQEEAPSPLLQESPKEDLGAMREKGVVEPALTPKGARALSWRRAYKRLARTVAELHFLLMKGKKKSPITCSAMVKYVIGDLKALFPEIIARVAEHVRYVFGFELKLGRKHHTSMLINKPKPLEAEEDLGLGLLMMTLGLISAREAQVWEMLRRLGVCPSKYQFLFGYPKRLIMEDFVQQRYPNRRVPHTNPPECAFSGPRSNLETSKMKILGFVAKLHKKGAQHWPVRYREALADEADRARAEARMRAESGPMRARADEKASSLRGWGWGGGGGMEATFEPQVV
ncbi:LOW QUALITY PROTEIN: melanoma-associated antigen F1 [Hipposideros larvatus]